MQIDRFNELLNGALSHPMPAFVITRLSMALQYVVQQTGQAGDLALEEFCRFLEEKDNNDRT